MGSLRKMRNAGVPHEGDEAPPPLAPDVSAQNDAQTVFHEAVAAPTESTPTELPPGVEAPVPHNDILQTRVVQSLARLSALLQSGSVPDSKAEDEWRGLQSLARSARVAGQEAPLRERFASDPVGLRMLDAAFAGRALPTLPRPTATGAARGPGATLPSTQRPSAAPDPAREARQTLPGEAQSQGGSVADAIAQLVAAPFAVAGAAGSRVWRFLEGRFGAQPRASVGMDPGQVVWAQFDAAAERLTHSVTHLRNGPMAPVVREMGRDPTPMTEQLHRMSHDATGVYATRAEEVRQAMSSADAAMGYADVAEQMAALQFRAERLVERAQGQGQEDAAQAHIAQAIEAIADQAHGLPMTDKTGQFAQMKDAIAGIVERIRAFVETLMQRAGLSHPAPAHP